MTNCPGLPDPTSFLAPHFLPCSISAHFLPCYSFLSKFSPLLHFSLHIFSPVTLFFPNFLPCYTFLCTFSPRFHLSTFHFPAVQIFRSHATLLREMFNTSPEMEPEPPHTFIEERKWGELVLITPKISSSLIMVTTILLGEGSSP